MTLADAIRLGGTLSTGRREGALYDVSGKTCALGGVALALGIDLDARDKHGVSSAYRLLPQHFRELTLVVSQCPDCTGDNASELEDIIIHLNDSHHWTRDQIADFVESLLPPPSVEPAVETAECVVAA